MSSIKPGKTPEPEELSLAKLHVDVGDLNKKIQKLMLHLSDSNTKELIGHITTLKDIAGKISTSLGNSKEKLTLLKTIEETAERVLQPAAQEAKNILKSSVIDAQTAVLESIVEQPLTPSTLDFELDSTTSSTYSSPDNFGEDSNSSNASSSPDGFRVKPFSPPDDSSIDPNLIFLDEPPTVGFQTELSTVKITAVNFDRDYNRDPNYCFECEVNDRTLTLHGAGERIIKVPGKDECKILIASGSFGRVLFGIDPATGKEIAVKVVKIVGNQTIEDLKTEAGFLMKMHGSKYVLGSSEIGFQGNYMFVVMDKVDGESLSDTMRNKNPPLSVKQKASILLDVARGLKELHDKGIIHRDLKRENILIDKNTIKAQIIDLGLSKTIEEKTQRISGTLRYMSPEASAGEVQGTPSDIYSMGLLIREVWRGETPDTQIDTLLTSCLEKKPEDRASIDDVITGLDALTTTL
ncbi:MAG: serine/threonine-protein kinase [Chlamydiota bacterium]